MLRQRWSSFSYRAVAVIAALALIAAVASVGGPLALGALYLPVPLGGAVVSSGLATVIAIIAFSAPVAIWVLYSRRIASTGGLTAFVEAAAGTGVARVQAAIWAVSYA